MIRKLWDFLAAVAFGAIVYKIARGPRGLSEYERGYIHGSGRAMSLTIESLRDAGRR